MLEEPKLIQGGEYKDERGVLQFINSFDASKVKRVYFSSNASVNVIRAWQAHKVESRWFICVRGSFKVKLIPIKNLENKQENNQIFEYILKENDTQVLFIPKGYANGFQALEEDSKMMIFSDYAFGEAEDDNYKFDVSQYKW